MKCEFDQLDMTPLQEGYGVHTSPETFHFVAPKFRMVRCATRQHTLQKRGWG
ncbi:hypothetical protein NIES3585_34490 [Nodularia sp. NIES-3585]|nr:hypothetical protein NIES3585_34490 [Nodularia sp. NIES-3585]